MVKLTVVGAGYVGLVSGACLADFGNHVVCVDKDEAKIDLLKKGGLPIYESGLEELVARNAAEKRLVFATDLAPALRKSDAVFIAVGTPPAADGSANLAYVEAVAREIGSVIEKYTLVIDKSTVPVGSGQQVKAWIREELEKRGLAVPFDVVSNPEFLREGNAVYDFKHPDRLIVGAESDKARKIMKNIYRAFYLGDTPYVETSLESAELIKYASNAFLATKISFINEISAICEKAGANVEEVAQGMGLDKRIGRDFLKAGPGYGGSCFPKDTQAIAATARQFGERLGVVEATIAANEKQKARMFDKIEATLGGKGALAGKKIAVMGLAFKNGTNDIRESPALDICGRLLAAGAALRVWDPAAGEEARAFFAQIAPGGAATPAVSFGKHAYDIFDGADAFVLLTEWNQAGNLNLRKIRAMMARPVFCDLRNMYRRSDAEAAGFRYCGVGR